MNSEDKIKFSFEIDRSRFKRIFNVLIFLPSLLLNGTFSGYRFIRWYPDLSKEQKIEIFAGSTYVILYAIVSYAILLYFLIRHYKEADRAKYLFWTAVSVILCIISLNFFLFPKFI